VVIGNETIWATQQGLAKNFVWCHITLTMQDRTNKLDSFLDFNAYEVLNNYVLMLKNMR
jgi:hypothetical protein